MSEHSVNDSAVLWQRYAVLVPTNPPVAHGRRGQTAAAGRARRDLRKASKVRLLCGKCGRLLVDLIDDASFLNNLSSYGPQPGGNYRFVGNANAPARRQVDASGIPHLGAKDLVVLCHPRCGTRHAAPADRVVEAVDRARRQRRDYLMCGDGTAATARGGRDL